MIKVDKKNKLLEICGLASTLFTVLVLLSVYIFIIGESLPIWRAEGIVSILFSSDLKSHFLSIK